MSYDQVTDLDIKQGRHGRDFKENLIEYEKILKSVFIGNTIAVVFHKDKWYYTLADVAVWSRCGNIRTALFLRVKKKPRGKVKEFHGLEQFIVRLKDKYAIYNVQVFSRSYGRDEKNYDPKLITDVNFRKVPNLKECTCS